MNYTFNGHYWLACKLLKKFIDTIHHLFVLHEQVVVITRSLWFWSKQTKKVTLLTRNSCQNNDLAFLQHANYQPPIN